ncbi:MAG: cupin domain-containing protein [Burkholderiales bacterium]|nr:cupin domain-containing protein [Burkholderiales bacterium]
MTTREQLAENWSAHVAASAACPPEQMASRVARWGDIPASPRAFVDTYIRGHERTLYSVIGSGVTDNPAFQPRIATAENFHIDFIVAPTNCGAAMHWHDTEEVFFVHRGRWDFDWIDGATGRTHTVTLGPRDTISVPPFVHRSFRSLDGDDPETGGMLVSILGGRRPGPVKWDATVAEKAKAVGAGFDADGSATRIG